MDAQKVALVIGAGDATGGAIARRFAREGYCACVVRRNADKLKSLVEQIESHGGRARVFGCDARREEQVVALVEGIEPDLGPIDTEFIRTNYPDRYALKERDGIVNPEHIADAYWFIHTQPRDAWTFEFDLRPWMERW